MRLIQDVNKDLFQKVDQLDELLKGIESLLDERGRDDSVLTVSQKYQLHKVSERLLKAGR